MNETNESTPVIDLSEIDGDIIIGRFDINTDDEGTITVTPAVVDNIPDITVYAKYGNTHYCVTGSYVGNTELSTKVLQILKRELEG